MPTQFETAEKKYSSPDKISVTIAFFSALLIFAKELTEVHAPKIGFKK